MVAVTAVLEVMGVQLPGSSSSRALPVHVTILKIDRTGQKQTGAETIRVEWMSHGSYRVEAISLSETLRDLDRNFVGHDRPDTVIRGIVKQIVPKDQRAADNHPPASARRKQRGFLSAACPQQLSPINMQQINAHTEKGGCVNAARTGRSDSSPRRNSRGCQSPSDRGTQSILGRSTHPPPALSDSAVAMAGSA